MYIFIEFIFKPNCSSWYIEFFNNNWDIKSINIASYLIISKTFYSNIEFTDIEADRVSLKYTYNNLVNIFIRETPNKNLNFDIIMQTETVSQTPTVLEFSYTDSYHQDNQYWTWINVTVFLFASEPPTFDNSLNNISISRWSPYNYLLPHVTEPDGQNFTVRLTDSTPSWIELTNNSTLRISPLKQQTNQVESVQVEIVLTDETNAFSKYALNVTLQPYFSPQFGAIETISSSDLANGVILNFTLANHINAVDWNSNSILSWLQFNASSSVLMLSSQMPVDINWCRLWSTDTCGASVCSNKFNITQHFNIPRPPAITNLFGPLTIYVNREFEFEVPSDLFYSEDHSLMYSISVIYWSRNYPLKSNLSKYIKTGQLYLYLSSNFVQNWRINLFATDKYDQLGSIIVEIIVNACASKDCIKCTGPRQSDWTECFYNYKLNNEGQWLQISAY